MEQLPYDFMLWWLGDWLGVMVTVPLVFAWVYGRPTIWTWPRVTEAFALLLTLFGALPMYHRVAEEVQGIEAPTMNVTPERLRRQLSGLLAMGHECWPLDRLVEVRRQA